MVYRLVTGATGLLGRHLVRDLLLRDQPVAVLVRPTRHQSVEQRVDGLLAYWEEQWKRNLPRPVVLQGDIREPLLGLEAGDRQWVRRHVDRVLHSAASLVFYEKDGEPWASNVQSVRNILDLCRDANIRLAEHVSTAYVCGRRSGRVFESELDVGQEFCNDYERSKVQAEQLIRSDGFLQGYTIFRPSIIVGDSRTGYTSTFHGFYTPLRVAQALMSMVGLDAMLEVDYLELLGLNGEERKNFVPVDWVSDALLSIAHEEEPRNQTYALVSEHAVTVRRLRHVFEEAVRRYREAREDSGNSSAEVESDHGERPPASAPSIESSELESFHAKYVEQFSVYRSYWRDDPDFDCSNTRRLLPTKPCPEVTDGMLELLARYALESNFGFPPPLYKPPAFLPSQLLRRYGEPSGRAAGSGRLTENRGSFGLAISGPGGGDWTVSANGTGPVRCTQGIAEVRGKARTTADTFRLLLGGQLSLDDALGQGRLVLHGDQTAADQLRRFIQTLRGDANVKDEPRQASLSTARTNRNVGEP